MGSGTGAGVGFWITVTRKDTLAVPGCSFRETDVLD